MVYPRFYSLADVGYRVHPAANANFVAYIWRVAEFMHYSDVVGIRTLEQLLLQCNCVNLQKKRARMRGVKPIRNPANVGTVTACVHQRGTSEDPLVSNKDSSDY